MLAPETSGRTVQVRSVSELSPQALDWLWPGRLALGKLAIIEGDPGLGKTLVTLDLCARLTTGRPFPDNAAPPEPSSVILLNAEDSVEDTLRPRLLALNADLDRVFVLQHEDEGLREQLSFPAHADLLDDAVARTRASLVVIDPIGAFLDRNIVSNHDQAVRRALRPLARLAAKRHCAVLLVRHLNKSGRTSSLYRGAGSIAFLGACRSGWLVAACPDDPENRVLAQVKNNLAPPQPSLLFQVQTQPNAPPAVAWRGPIHWTADQLLGPAAPRPLKPRDKAREFLADFLEEGPRTSRDIWDAAQEHALSHGTLQRARQALKIRVSRLWVEGVLRNYWLLPGQNLPAADPAAEVVPDLEQWLAPLREKYPCPTPIDDL